MMGFWIGKDKLSSSVGRLQIGIAPCMAGMDTPNARAGNGVLGLALRWGATNRVYDQLEV